MNKTYLLTAVTEDSFVPGSDDNGTRSDGHGIISALPGRQAVMPSMPSRKPHRQSLAAVGKSGQQINLIVTT